jgi:hypothetical protein
VLWRGVAVYPIWPRQGVSYGGARVGETNMPSPVEEQPCYSMTSSARASRVVGMVMPSALAVLRLIMSLNFSGCSTGKSAGVAPWRMRSKALKAYGFCCCRMAVRLATHQ